MPANAPGAGFTWLARRASSLIEPRKMLLTTPLLSSHRFNTELASAKAPHECKRFGGIDFGYLLYDGALL